MIERVKQVVQECWRFLRFLIDHYVEDNCQTTAAALTYQTLFAVVPALTVTYTVMASVEAFAGLGQTVEDFIFHNVVPENVSLIQDYLRSFSQQALNLSIPSAIFLTVTAFLMLFTIERTFNEIWRIKEPRHGFQRLMMYWAVLTMGPVLVGLGIVSTTYALSLPLISDVSESPLFLQILPLGLSAATLMLIYTVVPNTNVPFRHALVGGIVVALVFEVAKFSFAFVMSRSDFQIIYGTFAVVPLFLLWIYVSWTIVLIGAELVKGLGVYRFQGSNRLESPLFQMLIVLEVFYVSHQKGQVVTEQMIRDLGPRINLEKWTEYRQALVELNLINAVERGGLVLSRDLSEISIWELYQQLPWPLPVHGVGNESDWEKSLSELFESIANRDETILSGDLETLYRTRYEDDTAGANP